MGRTAVKGIVLAAIGVLLLAAAGCGGDDEGSAAETQAAATTAAAETPAAEPEASDDSDTPDFSSAANCQELVDLGTKVAAALGGTGGSDLEATEEFLNEFADEAPEEIREDFAVIAEAFAKIADVLGDVDVASGETPSPEALEKLQELSTELNQAEVTQANTNITAWVNENC